MDELEKGKNLSRKALFWQSHILAWESCRETLSQAEYCHREKLPVSSFGYWKQSLAKRDQKPSIIEIPFFLPHIKKDTSEIRKSPFTLCNENGFRLEIENEFSHSALRQIIKILKEV